MGQDLPTTSYALLGLLTFGDELTAYELKQRADLTLRFYWVSPAMSQVYSEVDRLASAGLVEPLGEGRGRRWRITPAGRAALEEWMAGTPAGFPILKHPVALRLLMGHASDRSTMRAMLEEYLDELSTARADLVGVRESLRGADDAGEPFEHPALVAEWGLDYFDSEAAITRKLLDRYPAE